MRRSGKYMWGLRLYIALFVFALCGTVLRAEPWSVSADKKIDLLIVHSFEETLPDYPDFNRLVAENLKKKKITADIRVFYLDCDAYDHDGEIQRIDHYLDTVFVKPDVVLVTDDQATYSLLASRNPLLKTVPIVFSGVNFPNRSLLEEYPNVTGLWDHPDYEGNVRMIEDLVGIKRIRFFYDKTFNGKRVIGRLAEQYKDEDEELYQSLTRFLQNQDSIENDEEIANEYLRGNDYGQRPMKTGFYFINMREELGKSLLWNIYGSFRYSVFLLTKYDYTIAKVGRLATVPTFSSVNRGFTYGQDILGGYFTPIEEQVEEACDYVSRIVRGEQPARLPIRETPKKFVVDWAVLNRWHIPAGDVPGYIEIVNMPFLVRYKTEAIVFSSLLAAGIVSLIVYLLFLYRREARRKRRAQTDLWEEKEFLSLALEGGSIFAWKYSREHEEFAFDKEFMDSIHVSSGSVRLKDLVQRTHPDEREHAITVFINVVNGLDERGDVRARIDFNGRGYVWYEFRFLNISGILDSKSSVIGLVMNIQEYKNKEKELTLARDLASKAELKQSFLTNMSHEIRTPLNAIVGFSNILVSTEELPNDEKVEYIRIINKNCELLLKLINDILEISRIESGNMSFTIETCNLIDVAEDAYGMCLLQAPSGIRFVKNLPAEPLYIDTDVLRVKQVIVNFINNAFKFTSSGYVSVGIDNDETKKEVCIYVEDTGQGIPEEQQKMIFDRFYKVDEFVQGTGLGLSICHVIAEKLNGRIALSSEVGRGSRFGIVLPYADEPDTDREDTESGIPVVADAAEPGDENRPVVLIAEDSVSNYMVISNILKKFCTIVWAINGKDALEIVKKRKVDLVLMDIKMHKMDGITALIKIRKIFKHLPVIIQTAYAFDENQKLARQAGASGFIAKPICPDTLLTEICNFIRIERTNGQAT